VTHDPRYAAHAGRAIHLYDGRIVQEQLATVGPVDAHIAAADLPR
jgi:ABC-type siderophore export system fused ATPase/permease subunit